MKNKIAIILTTLERPELLKKCLESIVANWREDWVLLIGNQDDYESESYKIIADIIAKNPDKIIKQYDLDYNCGISVARNYLIDKANLLECEYVLLTADSIMFNGTMQRIDFITSEMRWRNIGLVGLNLIGRIGWEGWITLNHDKSFLIDFIDPKEKDTKILVDCSICRNFWIATTKSLIKVPYDNELIMCEHEDFFYRYNEAGCTVACTNLVNGVYEKSQNTPEYDRIRQTNFNLGRQRLLNKYSLKKWIEYIHLERIQQP